MTIGHEQGAAARDRRTSHAAVGGKEILHGHRPRASAGRGARDHGPERLGQEHARGRARRAARRTRSRRARCSSTAATCSRSRPRSARARASSSRSSTRSRSRASRTTTSSSAAVNAVRQHRGEDELDAMEFLALVAREDEARRDGRGCCSRARSTRASPAARRSATRSSRWRCSSRTLAVLDETDSGLDIDALRVVASGVNALRSPDRAMLVITHYQRLLDYIVPDLVHVLADGRIVQSRRQGARARARGEGLRLAREGAAAPRRSRAVSRSRSPPRPRGSRRAVRRGSPARGDGRWPALRRARPRARSRRWASRRTRARSGSTRTSRRSRRSPGAARAALDVSRDAVEALARPASDGAPARLRERPLRARAVAPRCRRRASPLASARRSSDPGARPTRSLVDRDARTRSPRSRRALLDDGVVVRVPARRALAQPIAARRSSRAGGARRVVAPAQSRVEAARGSRATIVQDARRRRRAARTLTNAVTEIDVGRERARRARDARSARATRRIHVSHTRRPRRARRALHQPRRHARRPRSRATTSRSCSPARAPSARSTASTSRPASATSTTRRSSTTPRRTARAASSTRACSTARRAASSAAA